MQIWQLQRPPIRLELHAGEASYAVQPRRNSDFFRQDLQ